MSFDTLANGNEARVKDYGPGGDAGRPFRNRFMNIVNGTGQSLFLPENSSAERLAIWNNIGSIPSITVYKGKYYVSTTLHDPKAIMGTPDGSPCWSPGTPSASYRTPAGCSTGFTDQGVTNTRNVNPRSPNQYGVTTISHGNQSWEFFQDKPYGCPTPFLANISVRRCAR